jgi:hypothetical protein
MKDPADQQEIIATWGLLGIGAMLLIVAFFFDPIGESPRTGVFDLGVNGTKWLLGIMGGLFFLGGIGSFFKKKK